MDNNGVKYLICPFSGAEFVGYSQDESTIFCPVCLKYHRLPDFNGRTMEEYQELNMCKENW